MYFFRVSINLKNKKKLYSLFWFKFWMRCSKNENFETGVTRRTIGNKRIFGCICNYCSTVSCIFLWYICRFLESKNSSAKFFLKGCNLQTIRDTDLQFAPMNSAGFRWLVYKFWAKFKIFNFQIFLFLCEASLRAYSALTVRGN